MANMLSELHSVAMGTFIRALRKNVKNVKGEMTLRCIDYTVPGPFQVTDEKIMVIHGREEEERVRRNGTWRERSGGVEGRRNGRETQRGRGRERCVGVE